MTSKRVSLDLPRDISETGAMRDRFLIRLIIHESTNVALSFARIKTLGHAAFLGIHMALFTNNVDSH